MAIVGPKGWFAPADGGRYFDDLRGVFKGVAELILRPASTKEVSEILAHCNTHGIGVVPFGAGTGGASGHINVSQRPVVVLSLERMNKIRSSNLDDDTITAEAGVVLADVQAAADAAGRRFGLSLASEGSCTIGGNLASNAGGIQVLRYGNARDMCLGVEAVMPDGAVLNALHPLRKNNTGYDLRHLLIGSEGTLGVITAACLKMSPKPAESITVMGALSSPKSALELLHQIRDALGEVVTGLELMSHLGLSLALKHFPDSRAPFAEPHEWYGLVQVEGSKGTRDALEEVLGRAFEAGGLLDAVIAESETQANDLWSLRERAYEYNKMEGVVVSSDTSVPLGKIASFIARCQAGISDLHEGLRVNCYGHIGDGNIHVNVFPPQSVSREDFRTESSAIIQSVYRLINDITHDCGGAISAEHGIGRARIDDLQRYGDPTKLTLLRQIKTAIDPKNILNPGALFPE
ncbi:FAD-binding oxidoreductase [Shimia sediminis]|uniref:FAD-binding oxidoreductase n=1 Tax=Shimia sediminis TaxID=2497945 RepID=UPI001F471CE9|nr:FAD-binding oxidoreductase [Shimia sediminis]